MVEAKRKSDRNPVGIAPPPIASSLAHFDPVEAKYESLLAQHLHNLNSQIGMTQENMRLRDENQQLREEINILYKKAYFDKLTGLPNQRLLEDSFDGAVSKGDNIVLLFIDLNKFKQINDTYGHDVGDEALKLASKTLASLTRSTDVIAHVSKENEAFENHLPVRYAGDEFIILFTGATLDDLQKKIISVKEAFSTLSFKVGNDNVAVGASIGAYERQEGDTLEHCKKQADLAMYADKRASRLDTTTLSFARYAAGYQLPVSTGYVPTPYTGPKFEPS